MAFSLQQIDEGAVGVRQTLAHRIVFSDNGVIVPVFTVPAGMVAVVHGSPLRLVETAFNDSGTDLFQLGTVGDPDHFLEVGDTTCATPAQYNATTPTVVDLSMAAGTVINARYDGQNSTMTTGALVVYVELTLMHAPV